MMENFPHRTDFQYGDGVILNSDVLRQARYRDYVFVYYRLREGTSYELLNRKIGVYMEKHPEWRGNTPLTVKVYPYKDYKKLTEKPLLSKAGLVFSGIGLLVLLTALFNYLLFSAGRMFNRRKELGIRELHGATAGHLYVPDRSLLVYAESAKSLGKPDGRGDDPGGDGAYLCL